jgi:CubicO group peptidase (beta-lactamase class C family)
MRFLFCYFLSIVFILTSCGHQNHKKEYDDYFTSKGFSGQVYISKKGEIVYQNTFGNSSYEAKKITRSEDTYLIGSITKQFTAFSILILEDRGLLSTKDSIGKYFPQLPNNWSGLTIHELLSHSAGIPDFEDLPNFTIAVPYSANDVVNKIKVDSLPFFQRGKFRYSSISFVLLAGIIDKVSGLTYCEFLKENIFTPLQMNNTGCISHSDELTTKGYAKSDRGTIDKVPFSWLTYGLGTGNLYSNVNDLVIWNNAINTGKLISAAAYQKWFSSNTEIIEQSEYEDKGDCVGYAWFLSFKGETLFKTYHLGGLTGYKASITRFPNEDIFVVTLSNVEDKYSNQIRLDFPKFVYQKEVVTNP